MRKSEGSLDSLEELDLAGLFAVLWAGRLVILASIGVWAAVGVGYALWTRPLYRAEVVLAPVEDQSLPGGLAQLGGLASLAGISLPTSGNGESSLAVLKSRDFAREFIQEHGLLTVLLANEWDATRSKWKAANAEDEPDLRDAVKYFDEKVRGVTEDRRTGLVTLSMTWIDADEAAEWANMLAERINSKLRARALEESGRNIEYLKEEIQGATLIGLQQSLSRLLESEMQKALLARGSAEFAFKVVDRAWVPKKPVWPRRMLVVSGAVGAGLFSGMILVVLLHLRQVRKPRI